MSNRQCRFPGCTRTDLKAHALCVGHYRQHQRGQELRPLRHYQPVPERCTHPGCSNRARARALCYWHHLQSLGPPAIQEVI